MRYLLTLMLFGSTGALLAQQQPDSLATKRLDEVVIEGDKEINVERLPAIEGTHIWSGKKNEVLTIRNLDANIAEKTARQVFAKVPGVFVYDMDGTGNQINIATRGLDPHRGWEFNIRRNDALTNSDMYGYPASHFSMPMEAVSRIQLVRGTGSLQYGAQFGGMLNYITKKADTTRQIGFESVNSAGSFGLLSTYNAVGGRIGKVDYYAYVSKRVSEGYRDNSRSDADAQSAMITYRPSESLTITAEFSHSTYVYQLPGALNDSMFNADPRQSTRSRNYYSPDIYIPSVTLEWRLSANTKITWLTSAVLGTRNSVMFDKPSGVVDVIDPATLTYAPRQVDIDNYNSYTSELRLLHDYKFLNAASTLLIGVQGMKNNLRRRQLGKGTTGSDYDLTLTEEGWGRDLRFKTNNLAFFLENNFKITDRLSVTPGLRAETGKSDLAGSTTYYPTDKLPNSIEHQFILAGLNVQYDLTPYQDFYAGWAQAYRPVILKDIVPASTFERVDNNLADADGYNLEIGYRGAKGSFRWDVSAFQLQYNNRLGILSQTDENGEFYLFKTNIGNSLTRGLEIFAEYYLPIRNVNVSIFTSTSWMDGRYKNAFVRVGDSNVSVDNNKVESAPEIISRNGFNIKLGTASISLLYSYTAESFADALNTETPSKNGSAGLVPAYGLVDINSSWRLSKNITVRLNMNNVTNKQYFTKRPQFYPGPGIWSSDGRSVVMTIGLNI
ncbi:TonB-dependent receptor [Chryseolinea sp. H1M3-3]|uniref:TonB-dependent receptor family protein n=1 Tax=Chryseolinea sp. H1M3-3 TaxID=3034144 RepID=UPI0023ED39F8|nr:TonB-dependent receptor [Chryseolinea sp. H1M3-3]